MSGETMDADCTCGGIAACMACQDKDAAAAHLLARETAPAEATGLREAHDALDAVLRRGDEGNEFGPKNYLLLLRIVGDVRRAGCGGRWPGRRGAAMSADLLVDPARRDLHETTGIYVRAQDGTKWVNADIAELDTRSLTAFLRSRGGDNEWAESVVRTMLGHRS